jgi:tetrahydromethanopterin S-methyltransferase subunit C
MTSVLFLAGLVALLMGIAYAWSWPYAAIVVGVLAMVFAVLLEAGYRRGEVA